MNMIKILIFLCACAGSLSAVQVTKGGIIPSYAPYELGAPLLFIPYNPKAILVGDKIADLAVSFARARECSTVFCFSSEERDFTMLREYGETLPNIHSYFGLLHGKLEGLYPYFQTTPHERPYEDFYRFPGSLLKPLDKTRPFLFGESYLLPTFNLSEFCKRERLSKEHFIYLNCGGNELQILRSNPELVKNAIVVCVKTYHQRIRKDISTFKALDKFMTDCGFELMSHYIYDSVIGDALYVKSKYLSAVFRSKEL